MDQLPPEIIQLVMNRLHTLHLLSLMSSSKGLYATGKDSPRWRAMRIQRGLPAPKAQSRKLHTDYDIVQQFMNSACELCLMKLAGVGGLCKACRKGCREYQRLENVRENYKSQREWRETVSSWLQQGEAQLEVLTGQLQTAESNYRGVRKRAMWRCV